MPVNGYDGEGPLKPVESYHAAYCKSAEGRVPFAFNLKGIRTCTIAFEGGICSYQIGEGIYPRCDKPMEAKKDK